MLTPILILLASAVSPTDAEPITIVDSPTAIIQLARYDLSRPSDIRRLKLRIASEARWLCEGGHRGLANRDTVVCVKAAIAGGNAQLNRVLAQSSSAARLATAIAITIPAN